MLERALHHPMIRGLNGGISATAGKRFCYLGFTLSKSNPRFSKPHLVVEVGVVATWRLNRLYQPRIGLLFVDYDQLIKHFQSMWHQCYKIVLERLRARAKRMSSILSLSSSSCAWEWKTIQNHSIFRFKNPTVNKQQITQFCNKILSINHYGNKYNVILLLIYYIYKAIYGICRTK